MENPYHPVDQANVEIAGLNIGAIVGQIREQGYAIVENFLGPTTIETLRSAFNTLPCETRQLLHQDDGLLISHQVSCLRPQEMQTLAIPAEIVRAMPYKLQRLAGYHPFGLGVDGRDPLDVLTDGNVINPESNLASHWREQDV